MQAAQVQAEIQLGQSRLVGYMRERGIDYFENSRRATLAQRAYAIENPAGWAGYGPDVWGITPCDGPAHFDGYF